MSETKTVAGAYAKIESHEAECAIRYGQLNTTLNEIKADAKDHRALLLMILLSVLGFFGVTLVAVILKSVHLA
jgi:hypothetical protein